MGKRRRYVVVDIDECLGDYVNTFYDWLRDAFLPLAYNGSQWAQALCERPYPCAEALHLQDGEWKTLKDKWRASGALMTLPSIPEMQKRIYQFHKQGHLVILCTTRPGHDRYDVEQYTRAWLKEHTFYYHDLWFTDDKVTKLLESFTPDDVHVVIDDDAEVILNLASAGFQCEWHGKSKILSTHRGGHGHIAVFGALDGATAVPAAEDALVDAGMYTRQIAFHAQEEVKYPADAALKHLVYCTHLGQEVSELLDCIPWKFNRKLAPLPRKRLLEEAVDVQKLLINVLELHGVTAEEFRNAFHEKSAVVEQRARGEQ
jgi:hypothetical protein